MPIERSQRREALIGASAIGAFALAFLLIFFLADLRKLFVRTDDMYVLMPSAAGLKSRSEVVIAGQTVGEVKEIVVRPPGVDSLNRVLVHIQVERRYREHMRDNSEARVASLRMMGDPVLDITPGNPALPPLQPDDTIKLRTVTGPAAAFEKARSLQASLQALVRESRTVTRQAQARSTQAARIGRQLIIFSNELREFTVTMQEGPINTLSDPEFNRILRSLGSSIGELQRSFARAAQRAGAARSDAEPILRRLAARADTISTTIAGLQRAIANSGGGLLVRAQTDTAIFKALHGAQAQLDSLIAETKRNPTRFWF
jgi:ABC-type transporter Mla subunit MlaD